MATSSVFWRRWHGGRALARVLALAGWLLTLASGAAAFDFGAYPAATIADAYAQQRVDPTADYTIEAGGFKYKVVARYTGEHRPLPAPVRDLLRKWSKGVHGGLETAELFDHEVEVKAEGVSYWLPIQNGLVEAFDVEALPDRKLTLFILYVGAVASGKVFVINEFRAHPNV